MVDYYYVRKRVYETFKSIQQPQLVHLCDGYLRGVYAVNDRLYLVDDAVLVTDVESGRVLFDGSVRIAAMTLRR